MKRQARIICLATAASGVGALAAGSVPVFAQLRLEPHLSVNETFSDNVDRDPNGQKEKAFITEVEPGAVVRWTGTRSTAALNLSVIGRHQSAGNNKGARVRVVPNIAGVTGAEIWKNHLFLDASGSANNELLDTGAQDNSGNRSIVQNYSAGPRLVGSFGSFADAQTFYRVNQVFDEDSSTLGDNTTHTVGATLSAGPDFSRIRWAVSGNASESQRSGAPDVSRRDVALDLEYIVDASLSLLGGVGYQTFDDGNAGNKFEAPTWDAGFRWRPGSRTDITMTYGMRDDNISYAASVAYAISAQTRFFANYGEELQTGQEALIQDLSFIGVDPDTGALIDTRTNLPFNSSTSIVTISDTTRRTSTLTTGLTGVRGRNSFGVVGGASFSREQGGAPPNPKERAYQVTVNLGRQLTPVSDIGIDAGYFRNQFKPSGRKDNEYRAGVSYRYSIYQNLSAVGRYDFALQTSTSSADEFIENRVSLGVRVTF